MLPWGHLSPTMPSPLYVVAPKELMPFCIKPVKKRNNQYCNTRCLSIAWHWCLGILTFVIFGSSEIALSQSLIAFWNYSNVMYAYAPIQNVVSVSMPSNILFISLDEDWRADKLTVWVEYGVLIIQFNRFSIAFDGFLIVPLHILFIPKILSKDMVLKKWNKTVIFTLRASGFEAIAADLFPDFLFLLFFPIFEIILYFK